MTTKEKWMIISTDTSIPKCDIIDIVCMGLDLEDIEQAINDFYNDNYEKEEEC